MTKRNSLVFFLITAIILMMCSVSVFATEGDTSVANTEETTETTDSTQTDTDVVTENSTDSTGSDDTAEGNDSAEDADEEKTDASIGETEDDKAETETETETDKENSENVENVEQTNENKKGMSTTGIVFLIIFGAAAVLFIIFWIFKPAFRERIKKFFREYKSELKKVVWASKADVLKNTKIVIIGIVVIAVIVGLLDLGLGSLLNLIGTIGQ